MKIFFNVLMSILFTQFFTAQINPNLIPYRKANLWGLADYKKKIVVNPELDYVMIFDKKLNAYQAVKDGKYGLIDDKGNWLISPISESEIYLKDRHLVVRKSQGLEYYFADTFEINKNYKKPDSSLATSSSVKPPESIELSEEDKKNLQNYSEEKGFNIYNWDKEYFKISKDTAFVRDGYDVLSGYEYGIYVPKLKKVFHKTKRGFTYNKAKCDLNLECVFAVEKDEKLMLIDKNEKEILPDQYKEISIYNHFLVLKKGEENTRNVSEFSTETVSDYQYFSYIPKTHQLIEGYLYDGFEINYNNETKLIFSKILDKRIEEKQSSISDNKNTIPMTFGVAPSMKEYVNEAGEWYSED